MILLFFGQPGSGKTTLADLFVEAYTERIYNGEAVYSDDDFIRIDGDKWREISNNKDYSKEGRVANLTSAFNMAKYLEHLGYTPILSFVAPYESVRQMLGDENKVLQVYLTYEGNRGRNNYFAKDFEPPCTEHLKLNTSEKVIEECLNEIIKYYENHKI